MKFRNFISILGLLIPIVFVISYALVFARHPVTLQTVNKLSIFGFNIVGIPFVLWIQWVNYFLNGLLIMIFALGLIKLYSKSLTNNLGFSFIFFAGLFWSLLCFFPSEQEPNETISDFMLITMLAVPFLSAFGFVLISFEIHQLLRVNFLKRIFQIVGVVMLLLIIIGFIFVDLTFLLSSTSAILSIIMYGVLGYYLREKIVKK